MSPIGDGLPMTLQDAVGHAVSLTDEDQRQHIWCRLMATGKVTAGVKGRLMFALFFVLFTLSLSRATALQTRLSFILSSADQFNEDNRGRFALSSPNIS